jgi:Phage integrase SAM-like domain
MTSVLLQNGSGIAAELRDSSENSTASLPVPTTLADLLAMWEENPPREEAMLRTTCARLADYHSAPEHDLTIEAVDRSRKGFRPFLESRKYLENSVKTYVNHVRILVNYATAAGWKPADVSSPDWDGVVRLATKQNCDDLARHLLTIRNHPRDSHVRRCG